MTVMVHHTVSLLLALSLAAYVAAVGQSACEGDVECPYATFCYQHQSSSRCEACWKCCLFSSVYGACPDSCNCAIGSSCLSKGDCGRGLFCAVGNATTEPTTCQLCTGCWNASSGVAGSCEQDCASGDLQLTAALSEQQRQQFLFMSLAAADLFASGANWTADDFTAWLTEEVQRSSSLAGYASPSGLAPVQISAAFAAYDHDRDGQVSRQEWVHASLITPSSQSLCVAESGQLFPVTFQGCPCTMNAAKGGSVCAAGLMCTWQPLSGQGPLVASSLLPGPTDTAAVCTTCLQGHYCPQGTSYQPGSGVMNAGSLTCPEGFSCPTPAQAIPCPAGSYCPAGSTSARGCDVSQLGKLGWVGNITVTQSVVQRLRSGQDQLKGNYCPAGIGSPLQLCQGGFYCPQPALAVHCPAGHFCPPGSSEPRRCKALSACPAGTVKPRFSWMFLVLLAATVAAVAGTWCLLLKWEVWGEAAAGKEAESSSSSTGGSCPLAADGTLRQPSAVATATWELQQLLGWYGGPPADVQRSLRHVRATTSHKQLAVAARKSDADDYAADDAVCELVVPGQSGVAAAARPGWMDESAVGGAADSTWLGGAGHLQNQQQQEEVWPSIPVGEGVEQQQQQQQQQATGWNTEASNQHQDNPVVQGPVRVPALLQRASMDSCTGDTPLLLSNRAGPHTALARSPLAAGAQRPRSHSRSPSRASVQVDGVHWGPPMMQHGALGSQGAHSRQLSLEEAAAAAAAAQEAREQLAAAYSATQQHDRLGDFLEHVQQQGAAAMAGPAGQKQATEHGPGSSLAASTTKQAGRGVRPLKQAAFAAMRASGGSAAADSGRGRPSWQRSRSQLVVGEAVSPSSQPAPQSQQPEQQLTQESGPSPAAGSPQPASGRSFGRQLSDRARHTLRAAMTATGSNMRRLAQYHSTLQAADGSPAARAASTGAPGTTRLAHEAGDSERLSLRSPTPPAIPNKAATFQEELLRVQRSARSHQIEHSASSWSSLPLSSPAAAGSASGSFMGGAGSFSGRLSSFTGHSRGQPAAGAKAASFTAGAVRGLGTGWLRAGSLSTPLHRPQPGVTAGRGKLQETVAEDAEEEPIDVTSVPTVTVEFDIRCVSMRQQGRGGADQQQQQQRGRLLNRVQGSFRPFTISCLLGPSGSGKSTLLDVLRGRLLLTPPEDAALRRDCSRPFHSRVHGKGCVLYDGLPVNDTRVSQLVGFVPQDDIIHADLTVRENLLYGAALRQPQCTTPRDWQLLVNSVLSLLSLRDVQHSLVGSVERRGISGGQRKRVNIGMELVGQPSVLYLDEPTSGLDAAASISVVRGLQSLSSLGMTLLLVAHQPRYALFRLFHQALVLGPDSELVYCGPPLLAAPYFEALGFRRLPAENPADWLMDIVGGGAVQETASGHLSIAGQAMVALEQQEAVPAAGLQQQLAGEGVGGSGHVQLGLIWRQRGHAWVEEAAQVNGPLLQLATAPGLNLSSATVRLMVAHLATALPDPYQKLSKERFCHHLSAHLYWGGLGLDAHAVAQLLQCLGLRGQQQLDARSLELALVASSGAFAGHTGEELQLPGHGPLGDVGGSPVKARASAVQKAADAPSLSSSTTHSRSVSSLLTTASAASRLHGGHAGALGPWGHAAAAVHWELPGHGTVLPQQQQQHQQQQVSQEHMHRHDLGTRPHTPSSVRTLSGGSPSAATAGEISRRSSHSSWSSLEGSSEPTQRVTQGVAGRPGAPLLSVAIPESPVHPTVALGQHQYPHHHQQQQQQQEELPLRSPACTPRTDLLPITPGQLSARSRGSRAASALGTTPRQQQQQRVGAGSGHGVSAASPGECQGRSSSAGLVRSLTRGSSCPDVAGLAAHSQSCRSSCSSNSSSGSRQHHHSPVPVRLNSRKSSAAGLVRSNSMPGCASPTAAVPSPAAVGAPAGGGGGQRIVEHGLSGPRKAVSPQQQLPGMSPSGEFPLSPNVLGPVELPPPAAAAGAQCTTGAAGRTPAARYGPPVQQHPALQQHQLQPRQERHQVAARSVQRSSASFAHHLVPEDPPAATAHAAAPAAAATVAAAVPERQESVVLKVTRLFSGAAASAGAALSHLRGASKAAGWVDADQLKQLQDKEKERRRKERRKAAVVAFAAAHQQPTRWRQLRWLLLRGFLKQRRAWTWSSPPAPAVDLLLVLGAGLIVGFIHSSSWDNNLQQVPQQALIAMTTLGVLSSMVHLRSFASQRALLLRELQSGVGITPSFLAQALVDVVWVLLIPLAFVAMYYYTALPEMPFATYYVAAAGVCWWLSGAAYLVAALLPVKSVWVTGVFLALVCGAFLNGINPSIARSHQGPGAGAIAAALSLSYNRWALELLVLSEYRQYGTDKQTIVVTVCRSLGLCRLDLLLPDNGDGRLSQEEVVGYLQLQEAWGPGFCDGARWLALGALVLGGVVLRVAAAGLLRVTSRMKYWRSQ